MLRGGSYVKITSLVRKFRVSQRTVERDFERLRDDLNAPLEYDKSKNIMKKLVDLELGIWNNPGRFEEYEILFAKETSRYVLEREWHKDQIIEQNEDGTVLLKFKSNQSQMIYTWLLSFGNNATVIKPQKLREKIRAE